jgi:4-amino-4-deoxy-L-arabinose transferase-like glycosyltransferase
MPRRRSEPPRWPLILWLLVLVAGTCLALLALIGALR